MEPLAPGAPAVAAPAADVPPTAALLVPPAPLPALPDPAAPGEPPELASPSVELDEHAANKAIAAAN